MMADEVNTGGGGYIAGNVGTGGGDFIGGNVTETIVNNVDQFTIQRVLLEIELLKRDIVGVNDRVSDVQMDLKLVKERQVSVLEEVRDLRQNVDPRWLRGFMIVLALVMIALLVFFSYKVL